MGSFDARKFYQDYRIDFADSSRRHARTRDGWIQIHCPFCVGSRGYHLGFHIASGAYTCYRCGKHSQISVIKALLACKVNAAREIQKQYRGRAKHSDESVSRTSPVNVQRRKETKWPEGTEELTERHRAYLLKRKYDPDELIETWNLKCVGPIGRYKWRIIAPIYFNGKMVSYQGRDITGKCPDQMKYKACRKEDEVIEHQTIVYGYDEAKTDTCVVVEGIADVWRLGPGAVSCFGISFTMEQVRLLASKFRKVFVMFDGGELNATKQAERLASLLSALGVDVEILDLSEGDPGEMSQDEADDLMEELGL